MVVNQNWCQQSGNNSCLQYSSFTKGTFQQIKSHQSYSSIQIYSKDKLQNLHWWMVDVEWTIT